MANTLLLPNTSLTYIATKRLGINNDTTVLKFLKENNVYTQTTGQAADHPRRAPAGNGGRRRPRQRQAHGRVRPSPQVVKMHIPMPFRFLPVWQDGPMSWLVPGIFRTGGVDIRRPGAVRYRDGI
jgi:hypothetical protein